MVGGLLFVWALCNLVHGDSDPLCQAPILYGEFRFWFYENRATCFNVDTPHDHRMKVSDCLGYTANLFKYCQDGTFRSVAEGTCAVSNAWVQFLACDQSDEKQLWDKIYVGTDTDKFGIKQNIFQFKSRSSGLCMMGPEGQKVGKHDISYYVIPFECQPDTLGRFFFRSKGELMQSGYLVNQAYPWQCISVEGNPSIDKVMNIESLTCQPDHSTMRWDFYETGELVNQASGCCLVSYENSPSTLKSDACGYSYYNTWTTPEEYADGNFLMFRNKGSGECADIAAGSGAMKTSICGELPGKRFEWQSDEWTPPNTYWVQVACGSDVGLSQTITNSYTSTTTVSHSTSVDISESIKTGCLFEEETTTADVRTDVSNVWSENWSTQVSLTYSCDYYPDGSDFKGGCMWQLHMATTNVGSTNLLWESSTMVLCTSSDNKPACAPFVNCTDNACTGCVEEQVTSTHGEL